MGRSVGRSVRRLVDWLTGSSVCRPVPVVPEVSFKSFRLKLSNLEGLRREDVDLWKGFERLSSERRLGFSQTDPGLLKLGWSSWVFTQDSLHMLRTGP